MRETVTRCLVATVICWLTHCAVAAETSLDILGRLPTLENAALSPDGSRIAYVKTTNEERFIHVISLADKKSLRVLRVADAKLREIIWGDNDTVLFVVSSSDRPYGLRGPDSERSVLGSYNLTTNKLFNPLTTIIPETDVWDHLLGVEMNTIIGEPMLRTVGGQAVIFVAGLATDKDRLFKPALVRANIGASTAKIIDRSADLDSGWLIDERGEVIASNQYNEEKQRWTLNVRLDKQLKPVYTAEARIEQPQVIGFSPDRESIWIRTFGDGESDPVVRAVSLKDGSVSESVEEARRFGSFVVDPRSARVIGGRRTSDPDSLEFFDSRMQAAWKTVLNNFPGEQVTFDSAAGNLEQLVVRIVGKDHGYVLLLFDAASSKFKSIGTIYDGLPAVAQVVSGHYRAADGLDIPAFITLPPAVAAKNLPLVVLPHGGPAAHDTGGFDWLAQGLASQGYVVLQPNFRGSNLSWKFMAAGFGEWGRKMQTDLSDGVRQLVKDGIVDPKRVCIVGASYGGYAALAGAALDTGVYRCAVSVAGIADLAKFQDRITQRNARPDSEEWRHFYRYFGGSGPDDSVLKARSPLQQVDKIDIPILLVHGRDDTVVPYEQSTIMADALRRAHKPVELVTLKNEDHWLSRGETRSQMLQATVRFLREHNPPD